MTPGSATAALAPTAPNRALSSPPVLPCFPASSHSPTQVYDFDAWKRHRSSGRYWRHMKGIFKSRTVSPCMPACPHPFATARLLRPCRHACTPWQLCATVNRHYSHCGKLHLSASSLPLPQGITILLRSSPESPPRCSNLPPAPAPAPPLLLSLPAGAVDGCPPGLCHDCGHPS